MGEHFETLYNIASAALIKDHDVFIYLCYDAVYSPLKSQRISPEGKNPKELVADLLHKGAEIICSNLDLKTRGIDPGKSFLDGVKSGGLSDLSEAVAAADKIISL
jgi:sulfur relay (sulfurtransferase) complex TusBCD TusD component (DsrE family)